MFCKPCAWYHEYFALLDSQKVPRKLFVSGFHQEADVALMSIRADKLLISVMQLLDIVEAYGYKVKLSILP